MYRKSALITLAAIAIAGLTTVGCSSDPKPEAKSADDASASGTVGARPEDKRAGDAAEVGSGNDKASPVSVDEKIRSLCKLVTSHFDFDSDSLSPDAESTLRSIAECFASGPGKGANINLIGHADERGETEYNYGLGQRRAGTVAQFLNKFGLARDRIHTMSLGELEATGKDEAGWALDRKVEITLAE